MCSHLIIIIIIIIIIIEGLRPMRPDDWESIYSRIAPFHDTVDSKGIAYIMFSLIQVVYNTVNNLRLCNTLKLPSGEISQFSISSLKVADSTSIMKLWSSNIDPILYTHMRMHIYMVYVSA